MLFEYVLFFVFVTSALAQPVETELYSTANTPAADIGPYVNSGHPERLMIKDVSTEYLDQVL